MSLVMSDAHMCLLQPVMRDTGGRTVQKPATVETETAAVTLWRASATVRPATLEHTAIRVCTCVFVPQHLKTTVFSPSWFHVFVFLWSEHSFKIAANLSHTRKSYWHLRLIKNSVRDPIMLHTVDYWADFINSVSVWDGQFALLSLCTVSFLVRPPDGAKVTNSNPAHSSFNVSVLSLFAIRSFVCLALILYCTIVSFYNQPL